MRFSESLFCPRGPSPPPRRTSCFRPETPPERPDPGLYSQDFRRAQGQPFAFANPDISKFANILPTPDPEVVRRGVRVKIRNYSNDAPAAGVAVRVAGSRWGIGFDLTDLGAFSVNLGLASAVNGEQSRTIEFDPELAFSVFRVDVIHGKDREPGNNTGWDASRRETVDKGEFALPFTVRNPLQKAIEVSLSVSSGVWGAAVEPASLALAPGANAVARLTGNATLGDMAAGEFEEFTITATVEGVLLGGLTYRLAPTSS